MKERMNSINASKIQGDQIYERNFERLFALCEKCLWSVTIFKSKEQKSVITLIICPVCFDENVFLIPLMYVKLYNSYKTSQSVKRKRVLN